MRNSTSKYKAFRTTPSQARGKERVRVILAAALDLLKEQGFENVTTNDIAERAGVPIGSLYRYYPNKNAIIAALTDLYATDIAAVFTDIGRNPMLAHLSWEEVLLLMSDAWVNYSTLNGPFDFLYAQKADPELYKLNSATWAKFVAAFGGVVFSRCPAVTERQMLVCFRLTLAAVEMGVNTIFRERFGAELYHDAISAVAVYMQRVCEQHGHDEV